jgi:hypothetical protein
MVKQLIELVNCRRYLSELVCVIAMLLVSVHPAFSAMKPDSTSDGSSPDMLGLHIGTTPAEARAIFKSRILVSDDLRQAYREVSASLEYFAQGNMAPLPNGTYLQTITLVDKSWLVAFTPVPGHECIQSIMRAVLYPQGSQPTLDVFEKTLVEKYGPPTGDFRRLSPPDRAAGQELGNTIYWSYDRNGTLRKPGSGRVGRCLQRSFWHRGGGMANFTHGDPEVAKLPAQCGAIFLSVKIMLEDNLNLGSDTLVASYEEYMMGFDAIIRAWEKAGAIIDNAQADASAAAIKKEQEQNPGFSAFAPYGAPGN